MLRLSVSLAHISSFNTTTDTECVQGGILLGMLFRRQVDHLISSESFYSR